MILWSRQSQITHTHTQDDDNVGGFSVTFAQKKAAEAIMMINRRYAAEWKTKQRNKEMKGVNVRGT